MPPDPTRRPSNQRVRHHVDFDAMVWVECGNCLGDGWHYPLATPFVDRARKSAKHTCEACAGLGAIRVRKIECWPSARIVAAPAGRDNGTENEGS